MRFSVDDRVSLRLNRNVLRIGVVTLGPDVLPAYRPPEWMHYIKWTHMRVKDADGRWSDQPISRVDGGYYDAKDLRFYGNAVDMLAKIVSDL